MPPTDRNFIGELRFADGTVWHRAQFDVAVSALGNRAPVAGAAIDAIRLEAGRAFDLVLSPGGFTDPNPGDSLAYRLEATGGGALPGWLHFDAASRRLSGTASQSGLDLGLRLVATDRGGLSVAQAFNLQVGAANQAPAVGDVGGRFVAWEDAPGYWSLPAGAFSDADADDILRYEARLAGPGGARSPLPDWLALDATTGALFGLADNDAVGTLPIEITAIDPQGASASRVFDLEVRNVNDAPRLTLALADVDVVAGTRATLRIPDTLFADEDVGDTLTLSLAAVDAGGGASALPDWLSFDAAQAALRVEGGDAPLGTVHLRLTATDASDAAAATDFGLRIVPGDGGAPPSDAAGGGGVSPGTGISAGGSGVAVAGSGAPPSLSSPVRRSDDAAAGGEVAQAAAMGEAGGRMSDLTGVPPAEEADEPQVVAPARTRDAAQDIAGAMDAFQQAIDAFDRSFEEAAFAQTRANAGVGGRVGDAGAGGSADMVTGLSIAALLDGLTRLHLEAAGESGLGALAGSIPPLDLGLGMPEGTVRGMAAASAEGLGLGAGIGVTLQGLGEGLDRLRA